MILYTFLLLYVLSVIGLYGFVLYHCASDIKYWVHPRFDGWSRFWGICFIHFMVAFFCAIWPVSIIGAATDMLFTPRC